jgi:hypothetical protein
MRTLHLWSAGKYYLGASCNLVYSLTFCSSTNYIFCCRQKGHAKRVVRVDVRSGEVDMIGPEYTGEFKWLRGVEIPGHALGDTHSSGCCLALPCNSENGCVLKIDPESSKVTTFVTGQPPNVDEGWLYHGGNLAAADNFVYAIPATASRVMRIDPREETTEYIGKEYHGKAKWYGGITGIDGCIYGIPHNVSSELSESH